jgi:plastocyanin domain-containing protein
VTAGQIVVTVLGVAAIGWVLWYFLWSRGPASAAREARGVQEIAVTVKGGYQPDTILVRAGQPVRLRFYRDETADCSERVVFEQFGIDRQLPAFETTDIEFTPTEPGEFPFRCGMSMLKGLLVVEPAGSTRVATSPHPAHHG